MKITTLYLVLLAFGSTCAWRHADGQASVSSMAEFKQNQDEGVAEAVRSSQIRAGAAKLTMGRPDPHALPKPKIIRLRNPARKPAFDNRRRMNVR